MNFSELKKILSSLTEDQRKDFLLLLSYLKDSEGT